MRANATSSASPTSWRSRPGSRSRVAHASSAVSEPVENIATAKFRPSHEEPQSAGHHSGKRSSWCCGGPQFLGELLPASLAINHIGPLGTGYFIRIVVPDMQVANKNHHSAQRYSLLQEYSVLQDGVSAGRDEMLRRFEAGGEDVMKRRAEHGGVRLLFGEPGQSDGSKHCYNLSRCY